MQIVLYALMIAGFGGMLWANRQYKAQGAAWGKPVAAVSGIFALLMAFTSIVIHSVGGGNKSDSKDMLKGEMRYQSVGFKFFGQELAKRHPGAKILVIRGRSSQESEMGIAKMAGFEEGLAGKCEIVGIEPVMETMEMMMSPEMTGEPEDMQEEMYSAELLEKLIKQNPAANMIVSFVGLPEGWQKLELWRDPEKRPKLALANAYIYELKPVIEQGFISTVLHHKPTRFDSKEPPADDQMAFDKRFLLITPENANELGEQYSRLFKKP